MRQVRKSLFPHRFAEKMKVGKKSIFIKKFLYYGEKIEVGEKKLVFKIFPPRVKTVGEKKKCFFFPPSFSRQNGGEIATFSPDA